MSDKPRIVVVSPYRSEYGPRQVLEHVCAGVVEAGFEPVLALPTDAVVSPAMEATAAAVEFVDGLGTFPRTFNLVRLAVFFRDHQRAASTIADIARRHRAKGVYSISEAIFAASLGARQAGIPNVVHAIGMSIRSPRWGAWVYIRLLDRLSDQLVACSSAVAEMFADDGVEDGKCTVVHNGVDATAVRATADLPTPTAYEGPRIGMVAAYDPRKGHELFLASAQEVVRRHPDARFYIIGGVLEGHPESLAFEQRIRETIAELGLGSHVELVGYVPAPDIYAWIRAMDVIAVPSRTEAFAHALLEAMICGRAVVATRLEGNLDAFTDGHSGIYVPREPARMAEAISRLIEDPDGRRAMGEAAAERAATYFDLSVTVPANAWLVRRVFGDPAAV
ncbi:MAG TPA: glycosyltransferase family 4 protein [Gaiellaceae bacterium]|nr:glycosyltransferase family 4 protein [Gaiellaceae bacterium]